MKVLTKNKPRVMLLLFITLFTSIVYSQGHTFSTFDTGTITGAGAEVTQVLDVTGLSGVYLFYVVKADFVPGGTPAYSLTIQMEFDNNGSTIHRPYSQATTGAQDNGNPTTLYWTGIMEQTYTGGGALRIKFKDTFTDGSGPYTSELQNVEVTIYYAPTPIKTFSTFDTGTITGGGAETTQVLDVTGLSFDYLFYLVKADFVPGGTPAHSLTIQMEFDNNGSTIHRPYSQATTGAQDNGNPTTLYWTGIMEQTYTGGGALRIKFKDTFTDGSGPYTSELQNVEISIFPATFTPKTFAPYNSGTITGGGAEITNLPDVTGLTDDYLFYVVEADFVPGGTPAFSITMFMEIDNNGSTIHTPYSQATTGALNNGNSTTLYWTGIMEQVYPGGGTLRIKFKDTFTDGSGPYTSELQNINFTIYPVPSSTPVPVELIVFNADLVDNIIKLNWQTATEVNNYGFEIERAILNSEFSILNWTKLGFVQGNGTTNSPKEYSFTDADLPDADEVSYRLKQIDNDGTFTYSKIVTVDLSNVTSVDDELNYEFSLEQNYPNPFNPTTSIKFTIPTSPLRPSPYQGEGMREKLVTLIVYNTLGQQVATLVNETKPAGVYEVQFNASNLPSGMYFYKLTSGGFTQTKKLMLLK